MALKVNEIFYSIQGESLFAGLACVFVRLAGCNLKCTYCDTLYAREEGNLMEIYEILEHVAAFSCPLVEITGGEPLLQDETSALISKLLETRYKVLMETNGSLDISTVDERCVKIIDIKCPSSSESQSMDLENLKRLNQKDQVKFVIGSREDYEFAKKIIPLIPSWFPGNHILFSPVSDSTPDLVPWAINPAELAKWMLEDHLNVRLHLQLHKILWPDIQKGV